MICSFGPLVEDELILFLTGDKNRYDNELIHE